MKNHTFHTGEKDRAQYYQHLVETWQNSWAKLHISTTSQHQVVWGRLLPPNALLSKLCLTYKQQVENVFHCSILIDPYEGKKKRL